MRLGDDFFRRLEGVLSCPTAPFHEGRVHAVIRRIVKESRCLRDRVDRYGNLEVVYGPGRPKLLYACHTDHPAFRADGDRNASIVGGIRARQVRGARLRSFDGDVRVCVRAIGRDKTLRLSGEVSKGTPLILDIPDFKIGKTRIQARAVDDLCAVAACLAMFDRLEESRWKGTVGCLFTRAEEVGFGGALAWSRATKVPHATTVINLEMSPERSYTPQGKGPILRVGDRLTTFVQEVSIELEESAKRLQKKDKQFTYQRALMDGGACEATVYTYAGFRGGALCLPLRNYHNHDERGGMGMEYVHTNDAENLVRWMTRYSKDHGKRDVGRMVRARLDRLWRKHHRRLERTAAQGRGWAI